MTSHCDAEPGRICAAAEAIPSSPRASVREWSGLALLALPTILLGLDLTLLHLALPALAADLRPSSTQALWIMDAYGFMIAGFLITMGTLGDRIGRRKLLMIGATAFAVASVAAAFSTSATMLIAARAALGVAAATLMPSTLALISNLFADPRQRALGFGIWTTMFALGMALGPVVGGVLLAHFWWGAAFLIAVPVVVLLLLLAPILLPEYRAPTGGGLDLPSVALSLAAMLPVVYGIKQIAKDGIAPSAVGAIGAIVMGLAFGALFVRRQRRLSDPLLDVSLFGNRTFSVALIVLLVGLIAVGGTMLLVTQYLQLVVGFSPIVAGLWMGPPALAMVVAGIGAPLVARRIRPGFVVALALGLSAAGYVMLARLGSGGGDNSIGGGLDGFDGLVTVVAGFSLAYLGLGTIAALGTDLVVGAAPAEKAGSASAMSETVQDLGVSLGIAVLGSLSTAVYRHLMAADLPATLDPETRAAVSDSLWAVSSIAARLPPELPPELVEQARAAFVAGFNLASAASAMGVAMLAILAAVALRHVGAPPRSDSRSVDEEQPGA